MTYSIIQKSHLEGALRLDAEYYQPKYLNSNKVLIDKFLVYLPSRQFQRKIADLVQKSHQARKKSKEILEKAKKIVEEMIEKQ